MKVSIIIPVREINDYIREAIPYYLKQTYHDFEILIFPNDHSDESFPKTKIISTDAMGPAGKRDLSLVHAKGEILAFIDDDAYPREDWLENAISHFNDPEIAAVGGPSTTPQDNNIWQKASGGVFQTFLGGGNYGFRYTPKKKRYVDDFPSVNLFIRKSTFHEIGGFDSHYYPGEDTKLCLDITKRLGKKIIYDPKVYVWHHRRELFLPHLKQIGNYALHRGKFVKEFPETSLRLSYFLPSFFLIFCIMAMSLFLLTPFAQFIILKKLIAGVLGFYFLFALFDSLRFKNLYLLVLVPAGIFTTHIWYGLMFIIGLCKKRLKQ